jgi:hypothetical protein
MELTGHFFLRAPASSCVTRESKQGVLFALRQPAPATMFPDGLLAVWVGDEAQAFLRAHESELRPGRGLSLTLKHFTARDSELRARVESCELLPLPPSWIKHGQTTSQASPA